MISKVLTAGVRGVDGFAIEVEADIAAGMPTMAVVGLPDTEVKEAKDRVVAALRNSGFDFPSKRITVNLSPAEVKKSGTGFDLPIALSILAASGQLSKKALEKLKDHIFIGELGLDGSLRSCAGVLPMLGAAGKKTAVIPPANSGEAALAQILAIAPLNLKELAEYLDGVTDLAQIGKIEFKSEEFEYFLDFNEVKSQPLAKRALEIAAAGGHNILMIGLPGTGKSMLAKRFPSILPSLTHEEALEITKIYSVANMLGKDKFAYSRPFRDPHHTISDVALAGGGATPKPGEISLSHNGILFLDEFAEFGRAALEVLREPMETGSVSIARARESVSFPARFTLIAAMNPCPCGNHGHPHKQCTCTPVMINRYRSKISGPLLDRIDLTVNLNPVEFKDWEKKAEGENSKEIRARVTKAREIQKERFKNSKTKVNAFMTTAEIKKFCPLPEGGGPVLEAAMRKLGLSARSLDKILKTARTIADLEGSKDISKLHIMEVLQYRPLDRKGVADV
ncbi:putative ATPase with chaperone activity [Elusimicrobium minutum Pei191]|uniref:Putative ATPase with chaperone activity n=1 Tax=Elusimicrobium minutum (strain Pei191) TaxID=445932 RepID=B2KBN4_ELUMP|nr:YifB family Mg chelatase-like AAA ATPase [Elusimicrobium minutum]ACC97721.1 putative ATPase with chaperone activity [Elusimicrobium minutum Pei191]